MPRAPMRPCRRCHRELVEGGGWCPRCQVIHDAQETARKQAVDAQRPSAGERGYNSRWRKASETYLSHRPLCAVQGCGAPSRVVDHRIAWHTGRTEEERQALFWDEGNWEPLCVRHHNSKTARQDGGYGNPARTPR